MGNRIKEKCGWQILIQIYHPFDRLSFVINPYF